MWEFCDDTYSKFTHRLKVPGGWLVKVSGRQTMAITFFPDKNHEWQLTKK